MGADASGVEGIVGGNLVLPDVRDTHKLAAFVVVFDVNAVLDIRGFADVDNLFGVGVSVLVASGRPLGETGRRLVGVEVCGPALLLVLLLVGCAAGKGSSRNVPVIG